MTSTSEIQNLSNAINTHLARLNREAVWLFLTTLGIWGVTDKSMQFIAFLLTFLIFSSNATIDGPSFSKRFEQIGTSIEKSEHSSATKERFRAELLEAKSKLSVRNILKNSYVYFFAFVFLALSFANWFK